MPILELHRNLVYQTAMHPHGITIPNLDTNGIFLPVGKLVRNNTGSLESLFITVQGYQLQ